MGVAQWYARYRLPHAASSSTFLYRKSEKSTDNSGLAVSSQDFLVETSVATGKPEQITLIQKQSSVIVDELVNKPDLEQSVPTMDPITDPSSLVSQDRSDIILKLFRAGSVLVTTDSQHDTPLAEELPLLQNILTLLGLKKTECIYEQSFTWPVFHSKNIPVNRMQIQDELLGRWLSMFFSDDIGILLHFGAVQKDLIKKLADERVPLFIPFEYTLSEALSVPTRKAAIWLSALPHRKQLKASAHV